MSRVAMTHKPGAATSSAPSCLPRRVCQLAILDADPTHNEASAEGPFRYRPALRALLAPFRSAPTHGVVFYFIMAQARNSSADKKSPSYFDGRHRFRAKRACTIA